MQSSRGVRRGAFTLVTPANHYPSRLPAFGDAPVVKLVTPRLAPSRIGEYLVALPAHGATARPVEPGFETFIYALEGEVTLATGEDAALPAGGFAYLPAEAPYEVRAGDQGARLLLVKRRYEAVAGLRAPGLLHGHRDDVPFDETAVPGFRRRELLPVDDPAFDFNMSLLRFEPGVGLDKVEIHDEEHAVLAGDFIYMAPYCPQSFTATGDEPAEYLLYKDVWRDGF
jgi:(S)-ureidoglycine aminohydrolase